MRTIQIELKVSMYLRAYLRASTREQDAQRARAVLDAFAAERGVTIAARYVENESGASLKRPELFRLLDDSQPGDVLLVEQVDRLSRLNAADWEVLKATIRDKRVRVVALDLPTTWKLMEPEPHRGSQAEDVEDITRRMLDAVNGMLLDMLAAIARKDYDDRRRRAAEGIAKAKAQGDKYKGRKADTVRNADILQLLADGKSWSEVCRITKASRSTLSRLTKAAKAAESKQSA